MNEQLAKLAVGLGVLVVGGMVVREVELAQIEDCRQVCPVVPPSETLAPAVVADEPLTRELYAGEDAGEAGEELNNEAAW